MDDLKIVLYIIVAIIWVVYNNYKKLGEASKKRDFTKMPGEVIPENWPKSPAKPIRPEVPAPRKVIEKQSTREARPVLERKPLPQRNPIRRPVLASRQRATVPAVYSSEGGQINPSKIVQFEEQTVIYEEPNTFLNNLRSTDIRQAFIWSEVLKRPYN